MRNYIIRRVLLMLPTLVLVACLSFMLLRLVPGNTLTAQVQSSGLGGNQYSPERLQTLKKQLGIDGSIPSQFGHWVKGLAHGDFQRSFLTNKDTLAEFGDRVGVTIELGLLAVAFSVLIGIPLGAISGVFQDTPVDYISRILAIFALAVPNFWLALLIIVFSSRWFGYSFPRGSHSLFSDPLTNLQQFIAPALVVAAASAGLLMRLTRTAILDVMRQDYIRTARAKGLALRGIVVRHSLKNALIPVLTIVGGQLTAVITGAVVVEQIFNLRGAGQLTLSSILQRDYPQVQTNVLIFSVVLVVGNLLTDLAYGVIDPRIRYS
jgi:peptide/nickel transport system permease protein